MTRRVAVIGCGAHATGNILPSLRFTQLELAAVCDIDRGRAERAARRFGAQAVYTDYQEMLEKEKLAGVIAAVHAVEHERIAIAAMEAGLEVLTEKPPALDSEGAWRVVEASRRTGRSCMTAFKKRYAPAYRRAQQVAAVHEPGRRNLSLSYHLARYREPEDPAWAFLLDAGIHIIDLARFLLGDVKRLYVAQTGDERSHAYCVSMEYESGDVGTLNLSSLGTAARKYEKLEITLDGGLVLVDNVVEFHYYSTKGETIHELPSFATSGNWTEVTTGFAGEMRAFEERLVTGSPSPSDILSSYRSMVVYEAIRDNCGQPVDLAYRS